VSSSVDTLNDFAARTGIGVEALQKYSLAAKLAGVDTESFGASVQRLGVNIGRAAPGGELDKALKDINLSVRELRTLSPEQQFSAIGQAISTLPTNAERAAAAVQIFGRQGAALAPLFREGAASIEELQARAERLGAIVDQTQVNNVGDLNDAFDLVSSSIQGIIGQVVGNLAPAVTDVTEQLLQFVETFSGAQGTGGTGIANAISQTLLDGAEYLAGVFDQFVANFEGFSVTLASSADTFNTVANLFTSLTETLRAVFNVFEVAGNLLLQGLGNFLESLGSYVSSDLERLGQQLQANAAAAAQRNAREAEQAAANAGRAFNAALVGGDGAAAGDGAAVRAIRAARERFARERAPEFKVAANLDNAQEQLTNYFKAVGDAADESYRRAEETLSVFRQQAQAGELLPEQIKIMNGFVDELNRKLLQELETRNQAREATAKQAEEDGKRVAELLKATTESSRLQQEIDAVARESLRVQEQLAAARQEGLTAEADAAAARLAQLDQLQARLDDQQQAEAQGFADGFAKAFEATRKGIDSLIVKAQEFGNSGALAAQALQAGIERAQEQARDGIFNREAFEREVALQQEVFNQRLAAAQRVEDFLLAGIDQRRKAELDAAKQVEDRRRQAEQNVAAISERITEEQQKLEAARAGGRNQEARAAVARLAELRQVQRAEQAIVDSRAQAGRLQGDQRVAGFDRVQQFQAQVARQNDTFLRSFGDAFAGANAALAQANAAAAQQAARIQQILTPGPRTVQGADIRTAEGAALVLGLAANEQDPALIESRLQTKQLQQIRTAIVNAVTQYVNTPVAIL
jgi:hypothetical protein